MITMITEKWWMSLLRGILAVLVGLIVFIRPLMALNAFLILLSVYLILDGIVTGLVSLLYYPVNRRWWIFFLEGFLGLVLGAFVMLNPSQSALILVYIIAFWTLMNGMVEISAGIQLRKAVQNEWILISAGVISLLFGFILLWIPIAGAAALLMVVAAYLVVAGIYRVVQAFRFRKMHQSNRITVHVE